MENWKKSSLIVFSSVIIAACGGDESSSSSTTTTTTSGGGALSPSMENVALAANGGVADASYDAGNADLVNDGDTTDTASTFWAGNATGDTVQVEFDQEYDIGAFTIHTNVINNTSTEIQLKQEGGSWTAISIFSDCFNLSLGSGQIDCEMDSVMPADYIRVKITETSSPGAVQIFEIEAMGQ